jgi:archaellum biogenesis protein FlaJ (TadC family)
VQQWSFYLGSLTTFFSALALIFHLAQWIGFQIVTEAQVKGDYGHYKDQIRRRNIYLAIVTSIVFIMMLTIIVLLVYFKEFGYVFRYYMAVVFVITGLGIAIVCYKLCKILKIYYPEFYQKEKRFIIGLTFILIISVCCRIASMMFRAFVTNEFE